MFTDDIQAFLKRHNYIKVEPRAALIDMDGTLYDSMRFHSRAWHMMCSEAGIPSEEDEFFMYEGRTGASTINLLFDRTYGHNATEDEIKRLYHRKTEIFQEIASVEKMPGAEDLLLFMQQIEMQRILVTGSGQRSLIDRLEKDFPGSFSSETMITARDVVHGKPHPEPYTMAMKLAKVQPWQCVVIENAPLGVAAGDAAGAFTIGVTTGPIPREELEKAGAALVFDSMEELAEKFPILVYSLITTSRNFN
ncbi:MAG: HAD-IA family hydrolase [Paramuribaculum sp.]|nr:HAD-IA family hydrolase [Paramuribaculum sp.]